MAALRHAPVTCPLRSVVGLSWYYSIVNQVLIYMYIHVYILIYFILYLFEGFFKNLYGYFFAFLYIVLGCIQIQLWRFVYVCDSYFLFISSHNNNLLFRFKFIDSSDLVFLLVLFRSEFTFYYFNSCPQSLLQLVLFFAISIVYFYKIHIHKYFIN